MRHWEQDMLVHSARRKILSMPASRSDGGSTSSRVCGTQKSTRAKASPIYPHSLKGMAERKTPLSSPGQQPQQSSSEEEEQGRADLQTFTSRTSSLKDQAKYPLSGRSPDLFPAQRRSAQRKGPGSLMGNRSLKSGRREHNK